MEKILRQRQNGKQNRRRRAQEMLQERQRKNRELLEKMEQEAENQEQNLSPEEVRQKRDELDNQMAQTDMRRKCLSPYAQKVFDNGAEEACPMCREEVPTKWPICSNGHGLCPDCTKEHLRFSRYHRCPTCREPMLLFFIK
ncbi:MAG: hypothetical protein Q8Q25_00585 [bacterium]|nr:hypothetical protein [bacterium]